MSVEQTWGRPSYEKINYNLRPAKAIERRMLCETFGRLYPFQPVDTYGYVGLGSIYFTDFQLIHRALGIHDLFSMERDRDNEERFRLNLPFGCIEMAFASSGAVLPNINWTNKKIVWLDYDGGLGSEELADVSTVVTKAASGTFLAISINAHPAEEPPDAAIKSIEAKTQKPFSLASYRLSKLKANLAQKVPLDTKAGNLNKSGLPILLRKIILNEIQAQLAVRNELKPPEEHFVFHPVINFVYQDGAQMLTVGGILVRADHSEEFANCRFSELKYFRATEEPFIIRVPCLTPSEMRHLNSFLPCENLESIVKRGIPDEDITQYLDLYRYFPHFSEVLLG